MQAKPIGVTTNKRSKRNPYRAQIAVSLAAVGGKVFCLGNFATRCEAAEAYDNAALYYNLRVADSAQRRLKPKRLNDAALSRRDSYPEPSKATQAMLDKLALLPSVASQPAPAPAPAAQHDNLFARLRVALCVQIPGLAELIPREAWQAACKLATSS